MTTAALILSALGTLLAIVLLVLKNIYDRKAKDAADLEAGKIDLEKEGQDAFKNKDRGKLVDFLRRLRQSK